MLPFSRKKSRKIQTHNSENTCLELMQATITKDNTDTKAIPKGANWKNDAHIHLGMSLIFGVPSQTAKKALIDIHVRTFSDLGGCITWDEILDRSATQHKVPKVRSDNFQLPLHVMYRKVPCLLLLICTCHFWGASFINHCSRINYSRNLETVHLSQRKSSQYLNLPL